MEFRAEAGFEMSESDGVGELPSPKANSGL